jgi:hypothetical protein
VARYYDTVDYESPAFDIEIIGLLTASELAAIHATDGVDTLVAFLAVEPAELRAGTQTVSPTKVYLTATPDLIGSSWFADSTAVRAGSTGPSWLDVSADVARGLGVQPGDWVALPFGTGEYRAQVRRILAVARDGIPFVAVGPRTPAVEQLLPTEVRDVATVALVGISGDADAVIRDIEDQIGSDRLEVRTRLAALEAVDADPLQSMPILVAIASLGLATLIGLAIREGALLVARRRIDLAVIAALGVETRRIALSLGVLESAFVILALGAAYWVVTAVSFEWLFAAVLPPAFRGQLALALILGALSYSLTLVGTTWWQLRHTRLLDILAAGRAR